MKIEENKIYDIYDKFGIEDNEVIIKELTKIINDNTVSDNIKSKAYCGIGDLIIFLDPHSYDDSGYKYYKKALEYDSNNLSARVGLCIIFDEYPAPKNNIISEKEYLENLNILLESFYEIKDENLQKNIIQLMKNLVKYRLKNN